MPKTAAFKSRLRTHAATANASRRSRIAFESRTDARDERGRGPDPLRISKQKGSDATVSRPRSRCLCDLPNRGQLLSPKAAALLIFPDVTKKMLPAKMKWVRENVPYKLDLGHKTVAWFEADIRWWLETKRGEDDGAAQEGDG